MKLFFCDICNESIPLQDIKENRSTTIKGKIFCRACNPLNELPGGDGGSGTPGAAVGSGLVSALMVLVLGLGGAVAYLFYEIKMGKEPADEGGSAEIAGLSERLDDIKTVVKGLQTGFDGMLPLRDLPDQVEGLRNESTSRNAELSRLSSEMKAVHEQLVAVGNLRDRLEGLALRQDETSTRVKSAQASIDSMERGIAELGDRPAVIVERVGADGGGAEGVGMPVPGAPDEELLAIINKLSDDDAMARWEAVDQLRRRKDPALAPHVMTLLDDRDTFVRAQAIYTLGELKAMKAVPKLVKLLRDDETMIAEEALASLIIITGQNFRFDLSGSKAAREKGIRKWEEWMGKNKAKFE